MDSEAVKKLANELDISGCGSLNLEVSLPQTLLDAFAVSAFIFDYIHTMLQHEDGPMRLAGMTYTARALCRNSLQPRWTASAL